MKSSGDKRLPRSVAASGPFVEEQAGTQELFRNRGRQTGHEVFLVRDESTGELLLIHSLAIDAAASAEARNAVVTAARQALDFRHPAVLPVLKVEGTAQHLILAQSFPGGILLCDSLSRNGPLPPSHALQAMRHFVDALQCAETMGLTISQISPQDFIVGKTSGNQLPPPVVCLCPPVPQGWWLEVAGPAFASPEQKNHQPCNGLSSLYSAGALLAHMLTGRQPAKGETWAAWLEHQNFAPPLKAVLQAVLHEDPLRRSKSPAAWMQLLERAQAQPVRVPAKSEPRAPTAATTPPPMHVRGETTTRVSKSRWLDAVALGAVVCVGFVLTWQARRSAERAAYASRTAQDAPAVPVITSVNVPVPAPPPPPVVEVAPETTPPAPAPGVPSLSPAPSRPAEDVAVRRAQAATLEDELVYEARRAHSERRVELYRHVLSTAPNNREALHEVVEDALADFPEDERHLRDLRRWTSALENAGDPLGDYSRGRLLLEDAKKSKNLGTASESLSTAVRQLGKAADQGYTRAWFLLLQGLVNLHNVQQQGGNVRQAARTERLLFEKIDAIPPSVPVDDTRLLAERLEQLMAERAAKGKPHPQAGFLRRVVERLQNMAVQRGETVSQAP
ncbi:MAG: hypothetical protein ACO1TE_27795 [Prosthecobacter sp.]